MKQIVLLALFVGSALAATPSVATTPTSRAATASVSPRPAATPTPESVTRSEGTIPDSLQGTWLLTLSTPTQQGLVNNWHVYRIRKKAGAWSVQRAERPKPSPLDPSFQEAKQRKQSFEPSATAIKAMRAVVSQLKMLPEAQTFRVVMLRSGDQIPADPPPPAAAKDAKFSLEVLDNNPSNTTISAVSFYAKKVQADEISGDTHAVTIAVAGFSVVPMELPGTFRMYRLE